MGERISLERISFNFVVYSRDTKLSKIKTLRLAIAYITYLQDVLKSGRPCTISEGYGFGISDEEDDKVNDIKPCGIPLGVHWAFYTLLSFCIYSFAVRRYVQTS